MTFVAVAIGTSAIVGAGASMYAASESAGAAESAAAAQLESTRENIEFQKWVYEDTKAMNEPWYKAGIDSLQQIQSGIANGSFDIGSFMISPEYDPGKFVTTAQDPGTFKFDPSKVQIDPGYDFRLSEGVRALDQSASANGLLQSGAQQKAVNSYAQDLASQEYQAAYDRAYNDQLASYNSSVDQYNRTYGADLDAYNAASARANTLANLGLTAYNSQVAQTQNDYNMLNNLVNSGQAAAGSNQTAATNLASSVGSSLLAEGDALASNYLAQGAATAQGITGAATALNQGAQNYLLYNYLK